MTAQFDQILPAISKAMGSVKRLAKENRNVDQRYNFASIDDFLEALNPICAENGLIFHMQEIGMEEFSRKNKYGESAWIKMQYLITVYHVSGQSLPPVARSAEVIRTGAQSYGSAQSYALKQFMRALFLVPTGDPDDADHKNHGEGVVKRDTAKVATGETINDGRITSAEMKRRLDALDHELADCFTEVSVDALARSWKAEMDRNNWPNPAQDSDDYEHSYRRLVAAKFKDKRAELERIAASQTEEEMA